MHGKKQIAEQKKRMQQNLQKKRTQNECNTKLLKLCDIDTTNKDLSFILKLHDTAKNLLDNGADIEAQTVNKCTSLYLACSNKNFPMVKLLIAYGANVNTQTENGYTSLAVTAQKGFFDIVNILTMAQASPNIQNFKDGQVPLHNACSAGDFNIAKNLLEHNANPNIQTLYGETALLFAASPQHLDIVKLLFQYRANPNIQNSEGLSPLYLACQHNNVEMAKIILTNNANPDVQKSNGATSLRVAVENKFIDIIHLLFTFHANPNIQDNNGVSPLHFACGKGYLEIVEILLNNKAKINTETKKGKWTPLHAAFFYDHFFIVALLLKHNVNVNAQNIDGITPLHLAYYKKNRVMIYLLLLYGAKDISRQQAQKEKQQFFEDVNQKAPQVILPKEKPVVPHQPATKKDSAIKDQSPQKNSPSTKALKNKPNPTKNTVTIHTPQKNEYLILQDKKFKWGRFLSTTQQNAIKDHAKELKYWPEVTDLDIKPLQGVEKGTYRLRVGSCRIKFFIDEKSRQIFIQKIGLRKNIYRNK